eukprot:XP_782404.2 PREDICTED: WSC domain-containing protein 1 [Strongylocentrotus purpuratus]
MTGFPNRIEINKKSVGLLIFIVLWCIVMLVKLEQLVHVPARMERVGNTHQPAMNTRTTPRQVLEQKPSCNDTYSTNLMPAGTFPLVALASFPGSGDRWVRRMIERATGYATSSVYHIQTYEKDFIGEMRNVAAGETIVSGMHDYWRGYTNKIDGQISIKKAILIMRNPYQAIIDEFVRLGFRPNGIVDENRFRSEAWSVYVSETFKFSRWLKLSRTLFELCNHQGANSPCKSILIVYYDNLETNLEDELRRIMKFLDVDVNEHRLSCSVASADASPHRPHPPKLSFDPFTKEHHERLDEDLKTFHQWLVQEGLPQSPPSFSLNTIM